MSGSTIKVVLQPETAKVAGSKTESALNVHNGFISSGIDSMNLGSGATSSYKAGMNLTEKRSKFVENKPGTTITAVLNDNCTLKSLTINSPYILQSNSKVEGKKLYILMDGAVKSTYTFIYS